MFISGCNFVFCMQMFLGPPACVHPRLACVSMHVQPVSTHSGVTLCTRAITSRACPSMPARHCGSGPSLAPSAELWACFPERPAPLTQAPSLQLEQAVRLESGEPETQEPTGLVRQSVELRRQLQEEQASYRRKLQAYQEGQQRQAQLVQRLQAKVRATHSCSCPPCARFALSPAPGANLPLPTHPQTLQYKKKCSELEQQLLERSTELERQRLRVGAGVGGAGREAVPSLYLPRLMPHFFPPGHRAQP